MNPFKKFSLTLIIAPFLALAGVVILNLSLDPDHIFSKGHDYPFFSRGLQFYKNAGVINNYDIKNIIIGGSLMDNLIPSEVEAAMGWHDVYSLSLDGANQKDIADVTAYALRKHHIENVIISLQPERLAKPTAALDGLGGGAKNFGYLYDDNRLNDLMVFVQAPQYYTRAFFRGKNQRKGINTKIFPSFQDKELLTASKDLYAHYMGYYRHYNRPLFISSLGIAEKDPLPLTEAEKQSLSRNFALYVEPLIKNNPGTRFCIVIPPGTFLSKQGVRNIFPHALKFAVEKLSQYPNVKIYGFANDPFNADLRLYSDLVHYHIEIARFMIQSLAHDNHRLTPKNIDNYIKQFDQTIAQYKVPASWKTHYYKNGDGPYPKEGYITYYDAAKLVWGSAYNEKLNDSIPRSPYLDEKSYVEGEIKTQPTL